MSTENSKSKPCGVRHPSWAFSRKAVLLRASLSVTALKVATRVRETEAAELLEFALALPIILVMVVGLLDFSHAYSLKQKLANAAREGARIGGSEDAQDINTPSPASVQTIKDDVTTYLLDAGVDTSFIGTNMSYNVATFTGTYYTTSGGNNYGLEIERNVLVPYTDPNTGLQTQILSTRVTLYYPYDWTFGFNQVIKLLVPSSTFSNPIRIQTDAMMANP